MEKRQRHVRLAGLQSLIGLGERLRHCCSPGRSGKECKRHQQSRRAYAGHRTQPLCGTMPHRTTLMGTPSCKGIPLSVPVATQSPSFNPLRMATLVRLTMLVTTGVRTSLLSTTLKT